MTRFISQAIKGFMGSRTRLGLGLLFVMALTVITCHFVLSGGSPLSHRWVPGQRLVYRLEYQGGSVTNLTALTSDADKESAKNEQVIFTSVEGNLHTTVLEVSADGALIACSLRDLEIQVVYNDELALAQAEAIHADLSRTLLARLDRQGRIHSVHFNANTRSLSHAFVRTLLASTQFVLPDEAALCAWESQEGDPNGEYIARYKLEEKEGDIAIVSKAKTHYLPRPKSHSIRTLEVESVAHPSGSLSIRFDRQAGRVQSISGAETTAIVVEDKVVARAETTLKLHLLESEMLSDAEHARLARICASLKHEPAVAMSAAAPTDEREASMQRNELGKATLESLLNDLERAEANAETNQSDTHLYLQLKALVYLQPETCPTLAKVLSAAKTEGKTMRLLADALSSVGHAQAQAALRAALDAKFRDEAALAILIPALAMVESPADASEEALRQLAASTSFPNIRAGAELGLGTMANQLATTHPQRATRIVRDMAEKLKQATTVEVRRHYLFVLGNAGAKENLELIAGYLSDAAPEVRAGAAAALRWIDSPEADLLLCKTLAADTDSSVRIEAATALGFRPVTAATFAAQKTAFLSDASVSVRLAIMPTLARAASAHPEGRALLTQALNDPCQQIRDEAAGLLSVN